MSDFKSFFEKNWILIIILIVAFFLRQSTLMSEDIWLDEAHTLFHAQQPLSEVLTTHGPFPQLYLTTIHFLIDLFGVNLFLARFINVIFGVLSILLIYLIAKRLFNKEVGLLSAALLSLSPHHIYYSQEARAYAFLAFFSLLSFFYFFKYMKFNKRKYLILYLISNLFLLFSHLFGILIIPVQTIYYYMQKRDLKKTSKFVLLQATSIIIYSFSLLFTYHYFFTEYGTLWMTIRDSMEVIWLPHLWAGWLPLTIMFILIIIYGLFQDHKNEKQIFLLIWWLLPVIITLAYSLLLKPIILARYLIYCMMPFYILISSIIIKQHSNIKKAMIFLVLILSLLVSTYLISSTHKFAWSAVSQELSNQRNGELLIIDPGQYSVGLAYFYLPTCFNLNIYDCLSDNNIKVIWPSTDLTDLPDNFWYLTVNHRTVIRNMDFENLMLKYNIISQTNYTRASDDAYISLYYLEK